MEPSPGQAPPRRPVLFVAPNIADDLRQLPSIFMTRRLLWLPLGLLLAGVLMGLNAHYLSSGQERLASHYVQVFVSPPALPTFVIAGLVAPRASYLVGIIYGLMVGLLWAFAVTSIGVWTGPDGMPTTSFDLLAVSLQLVALGVIYGVPLVLLGRIAVRAFIWLRSS